MRRPSDLLMPRFVGLVAAGAVIVATTLPAGCTKQSGTAPPSGQAASASPKDTQPSARKGHAFRGKVEKVDPATKTLTVNGEDVEGWMPAMTMVYGVEKEDVLARIAVGDQITATVYDGDFKTLYDVRVSPAKPQK